MKVNVTITVDIDTEAWTLNYGVEGTREIRADVKAYVEDAVHAQLSDVGVLIRTPYVTKGTS